MNKVNTFLIDFDSIFDTRLGTLLTNYSKDIVYDCITVDYYRREIDSFSISPFIEFKEIYAKRDKVVLSNSIITPMIGFLTDFVKESYKNSINGHEVKKPKIMVNIYPYKLIKEEMEAIKEMLIAFTKGLSMIEFINSPFEDITPIYIKNNIDAMCFYSYPEWLEMHSVNDNLKINSIPSIALFGPRIFFKEVTTEERLFINNEKIDPFELLESSAQPIVCLKLLTSFLFSADLINPAKEAAKIN